MEPSPQETVLYKVRVGKQNPRDPRSRVSATGTSRNSMSRVLDENTTLDLDAQGNIRAMTIAHASKRTDAPQFSYEQVAA